MGTHMSHTRVYAFVMFLHIYDLRYISIHLICVCIHIHIHRHTHAHAHTYIHT